MKYKLSGGQISDQHSIYTRKETSSTEANTRWTLSTFTAHIDQHRITFVSTAIILNSKLKIQHQIEFMNMQWVFRWETRIWSAQQASIWSAKMFIGKRARTHTHHTIFTTELTWALNSIWKIFYNCLKSSKFMPIYISSRSIRRLCRWLLVVCLSQYPSVVLFVFSSSHFSFTHRHTDTQTHSHIQPYA